MNVKELFLLPKSTVNRDYVNQEQKLLSFFDYNYKDASAYSNRLMELSNQTFQRKALMEALTMYQQRFTYKEQALQQIEKLKDERSVMVVGGQQAGLLTGPLYTVYKAVSVILLAREQEKKLGVPVIPLFWIAGEDHDLDEINFVSIEKEGRWVSHRLYQDERKAATDVALKKEELQNWIDDVFSSLPETEHTQHLLHGVLACMERSNTYVDFFGEIISWLFKDEGLVLLDSGDPLFRQLEGHYFARMISEVEDIQRLFMDGAKAFEVAGYGRPIETEESNAHLFYVDGEIRRRIDFENGRFTLRGTDKTLTKEQLIKLAEQHPERFSNNVVTRPLMQEFLLPVLAFVAGPGELAYWATLKGVFHHFGLSVPPVILRMSVTFVPRDVQKWVEENNYSYEEIITNGTNELREAWYQKQKTWPIGDVTKDVIQKMREVHRPLRELAEEIDPTMTKLAEKNAFIIEEQIAFLERRLERQVRSKYDNELRKFDYANHWLRPQGQPQERFHHVMILLNLTGDDFFTRILDSEIKRVDAKYLIKL
ncbi:bacillithiol biosynthesis cysteine-adding enzyme BshC [Halalkalibacterium ligniniphilum]|uniref:bacillithiol biosynthesis cysteine-adding enzyme BshC n=1 Tax=Halalkalibacterium ligniniphilum TaxID=1134413 RepID=UPI00034B400B|nr:bacillithiol biosynthesis cysteine-adding enzyme BshC [Halalkalibacterium ligniniphilum]